METLIPELSRLLKETLSPDQTLVSSAADGLDRLSELPRFPFALLSIATGSDSQGIKLAAATYLKNFTRCHVEGKPSTSDLHIEFRDQLAQALLQVEPVVLKLLTEAFRPIIVNDFVRENSWPDFVPKLKSAIESSNLISQDANSQWSTINALNVLQTIVKPFQYFLNPKVPKEPVPLQLELIAKDILVPLQASFHHFVDKALSCQNDLGLEVEQVFLIFCKCMHFTVRSYMPSALCPLLSSFCGDLFRILDSLRLTSAPSGSRDLIRLKTAKRSLTIFCSLVTRHRKHSHKLLPSIINCAIRITKMSPNMLEPLSERIISLAFDVISHVLETGPGWRLVSPHFSSLLNSAIFPALTLNKKDISDWEEDAEEYIRKNLPSELDEISGWSENLFTARKSAINLLGVIAMSKGPPVASAVSKRKKIDKSKRKEHQSSIGELLVIPFLSKFPVPSDGNEPSSKTLQDYYGVLMAYGGLQDFLNERNPDYTSMLVQNRVLPLYSLCSCSPYLMATANWVLGALASCLPEALSADIYNSLMKALATPDMGDVNCYPVRVAAAGAIAELLENDYTPPDWLSLLQVLVNRIDSGDENESSLLFQLLGTVIESAEEKVANHIPLIVSSVAGVISKNIPLISEPWPQVVERGFTALASTVQIWEDYVLDDIQQQNNTDYMSSCASIARIFSSLLQQAWLLQLDSMEETSSSILPASSGVDDASRLLGFIMRSVKSMDKVVELKLRELLAVWASIIADWQAWEEMEDLAIFSSIQEAVNLHRRCDYNNFFIERVASQNSSNGFMCSIIEGISAFVSAGINAYPSAARRACSCVHALLHVPRFSVEAESIRQSIAVAFTVSAFSRCRDILQENNKRSGLCKSLILAISSCYILYPENIERVLEKEEDKGFILWLTALADLSTSFSESGLSESEIKLAVITLTKVVEHLLQYPSDRDDEVLHKCFVSLIEATIHLKEVQENDRASDEDIDNGGDDDNDNEEESDYDEDSEDEELEETEEEFLDRYAKVAADLEDNMVEEGDLEDEEHELDLGPFEEIDIQTTILDFISRHHQILLRDKVLPPNIVTGFVNSFPQCSFLFQAS
ncbi:uncharacterized protein A4U43_C08F32130 [Asparagus officinalis]|uniref:importin beta-like SAD2 homolog isoform X2 n=1 Tax=Asparagus officinalis TaxID=4686 RepID=UPI00098E4AE7|nr:importin beta-like SAD2 homolog isoform X2 [Asparagus officinalis]ONK61647.1 uncharacterized protein A4U43_C08F32130 [Asparagus officinalis]